MKYKPDIEPMVFRALAMFGIATLCDYQSIPWVVFLTAGGIYSFFAVYRLLEARFGIRA